MEKVRTWFGWLAVVLVLHGVEQLMTGLDELYEIQGQIGMVLAPFENPDLGIVLMVFAGVLLVYGLVYTSMLGGRWRLLAPGFFGVMALVESHHIIKTIVHLHYFPGAVTAIAFVTVGILLLRAVVREWKSPALARG